MPTDHNMTSPPAINLGTPSAFDTALADIADVEQRALREITPMITASGARRFAVLSNTTEGPPPLARSTPSPLPGFAELTNLETERTTWFVDIASLHNYRAPSPLTDPMSSSSSSSSPPGLAADIAEVPQPQQYPVLASSPFLFHRLMDVKAKFWALLTLEISNCLRARMSQKLAGREPSKTLFQDVYQEAIDRRIALSGDLWEHITVTLDVPTQVTSALNPRVRVVEKEVETTPFDINFINALKASFTGEWVQFRANCYKNAGSVCLPHTFGICVGVLPHRTQFTPQYRTNLKQLLTDRTFGLGLLHQVPSFGDEPASEFSWFGNPVLKNVIHGALYNPLYPGWFGFLEGVKSAENGCPSWAPLPVATLRQLAQVISWIVAFLEYQLQEADKAELGGDVVSEYSEPPGNYATASSADNVGKLASYLNGCFCLLRGGSGDIDEMDKYKAFKDLNAHDYKSCADALTTLLSRPAHLPYAQSVAALNQSSHLVG